MSSTGSFEHLPLANGDVAEVHIRVDGRARRISIKVDRIGGLVTLTAPSRSALPAARRFLSRRVDWIAERRAGAETAVPLVPGRDVPVLGRPRRIDHDPQARDLARLLPDSLVVGGRASAVDRTVRTFLKAEARRRLEAAAQNYAARIGRRVAAVSVRDQKTRWGSCAASGRLSFSWRLVMAPERVLTYVAAHEVAHLRHMNHSPDFWSLVAKLDPDWRAAEKWLKHEGPALRRYG